MCLYVENKIKSTNFNDACLLHPAKYVLELGGLILKDKHFLQKIINIEGGIYFSSTLKEGKAIFVKPGGKQIRSAHNCHVTIASLLSW